jgi:HEAT repeat protein
MPFLLEHVAEVVSGMMIVILTCSVLIIGFTILRRRRRETYFQRIDDLRERFSTLIAALLDGTADYDQGCDALDAITGRDRVHALELLLLERKPVPGQVPILRRLCQDLGLVAIWQRQLTGENEGSSRGSWRKSTSSPLGYLIRAASAQKLGRIRHQPSWPLLVKALNDAHPDVCSVAAASLAAIGEPESLKAILDRLHTAILSPASQVSIRSLKMALISFPLDQADKFLPSLQESQGQIRFLAVDILREMTERAATLGENFVLDSRTFSAKLSETFLTRLCKDSNPDVRARSAPIIAYMDSPRAISALLYMLEDEQWYVRLHAVRALAKYRFISRAGLISNRLTDSQWMVREAAARTLLSFGRVGLDQVWAHLLNTQDRYSKEQIADDIQRAGLIPAILTQFGSNGECKERHVLEQLADLGKTSYLLATLAGSSDHTLRMKFLSNYGQHPDPQIRSWVKSLAARKHDADLGPRILPKDAA